MLARLPRRDGSAARPGEHGALFRLVATLSAPTSEPCPSSPRTRRASRPAACRPCAATARRPGARRRRALRARPRRDAQGARGKPSDCSGRRSTITRTPASTSPRSRRRRGAVSALVNGLQDQSSASAGSRAGAATRGSPPPRPSRARRARRARRSPPRGGPRQPARALPGARESFRRDGRPPLRRRPPQSRRTPPSSTRCSACPRRRSRSSISTSSSSASRRCDRPPGRRGRADARQAAPSASSTCARCSPSSVCPGSTARAGAGAAAARRSTRRGSEAALVALDWDTSMTPASGSGGPRLPPARVRPAGRARAERARRPRAGRGGQRGVAFHTVRQADLARDLHRTERRRRRPRVALKSAVT